MDKRWEIKRNEFKVQYYEIITLYRGPPSLRMLREVRDITKWEVREFASRRGNKKGRKMHLWDTLYARMVSCQSGHSPHTSQCLAAAGIQTTTIWTAADSFCTAFLYAADFLHTKTLSWLWLLLFQNVGMTIWAPSRYEKSNLYRSNTLIDR